MGHSKVKGGLGFRDLGIFNKALLSKQIWKLLQNPDSLAATILKAKYYPSCSILEASMGNRSSYVWRSFMAAQPVLQNGLIWRVGEGNDIGIWTDRWVPKPTTYKIHSPRMELDRNARVLELIDHDTRRWKDDMILRIFLDDEAKIIRSIPLSPLPTEDRIIWRGTENGIFSIRSAYFLEVEKTEARRGEASRPVEGVIWKECWSLNVPNVVKLFLWRALHDLLPTRVNLAKKRGSPRHFMPYLCNGRGDGDAYYMELPSISRCVGCRPKTLAKNR
jgi:hypothetical protein